MILHAVEMAFDHLFENRGLKKVRQTKFFGKLAANMRAKCQSFVRSRNSCHNSTDQNYVNVRAVLSDTSPPSKMRKGLHLELKVSTGRVGPAI